MNEYETKLHGKAHGNRGTLHEKLNHIGNVLGKSTKNISHKEAMDKGFSIHRTMKEHQHPYWDKKD